MSTICEEAEDMGSLIAYEHFLDNSHSCLLDYDQFKLMLEAYEKADPKPDFWDFQKAWHKVIQRDAAQGRVDEAKRDLKQWEVAALTMLKEMDECRPVPQNPQTHKDLGRDI